MPLGQTEVGRNSGKRGREGVGDAGGLEAAGHVAVPRRRAERGDVAAEPHFACHEQLVSSPS